MNGPTGEEVQLDVSSGLSGSLGDVAYVAVGDFDAAQTGSYQVQCVGGGTTLISPAVDFGTVGGGALGLLGGILGVGLGLLMMLIGAVLWFIGRSQAKKAAGGPMGGGNYGTAPPPPPSGY